MVIGGDGQVSIGQTIVKANAKKVRRLGKGDVIGGFAGATADAFTLFERLEAKLEQYPGQLTARRGRARQGLAHRPLSAPAGSHDDRRRQAGLAGAHRHRRRAGAGNGVAGIGSGGNYALAAARALLDGPLDAEADREQVARHRRRHLRLHQPQRDHRVAEDVTDAARSTLQTGALIAVGVLAIQATVLLAMGRVPICTCGTVKLWWGVVQSSENSQHILDWYSFSHIIHGFIFYFLDLAGAAARADRAALCARHRHRGVVGNLREFTPFIIERYRAATISLQYYGDSVINSLSDTVCMVVGFVLARRLPHIGGGRGRRRHGVDCGLCDPR